MHALSSISTGQENLEEKQETANLEQQLDRASKNKKKMIYRKWSLLTGPAAILCGIVGSVVIANFIFLENDPFLKPEPKKPAQTSNK